MGWPAKSTGWPAKSTGWPAKVTAQQMPECREAQSGCGMAS